MTSRPASASRSTQPGSRQLSSNEDAIPWTRTTGFAVIPAPAPQAAWRPWSCGQAGRESRAHEVDEVVAVEALLDRVRRVAQRPLEPADRVPPALDVGVVGGEHADLLARLR